MLTKEQKTEARFESYIKLARILVSSIENEADEVLVVSMLMNTIFKLPSKFTGLTSVKASNLIREKRTPEHFFSRTESAKRLLKEIKKNPSRSDAALIKFVKSRCRVHHVTRAENNLLRSWNKKNPKSNWRHAYSACGIELIKLDYKKRGRNEKYVYMVGDVVYNTLKEVAAEYNLSLEGARNRFFKAKKFKDWTVKEI